jgi:1,4-alpha-glucan branching enzyme
MNRRDWLRRSAGGAGLAGGERIEKADPFAFASELRPKSASIVCDLGNYRWRDQPWIRRREMTNWYEQPISIYELHLGSWRKPRDGRSWKRSSLARRQVLPGTSVLPSTWNFRPPNSP